MKIRYLKLMNWLMVTVMGVFGLSACRSNKDVVKNDDSGKDPQGYDRHEAVRMYGVPERRYADTVAVLNDSESAAPSKEEVVEQPRSREPQVTVYGVPTVDYSVKGRVVDAAGKPIKGLQVLLVDSRIDPDNLPKNEYWDEELRRMSDTTDAKGTFDVKGSDRPWEKLRVLVRDIDGAKNGTYEQQLVEVQFGEAEQGDKPVSSWNLGIKKAEITVKMRRKK